MPPPFCRRLFNVKVGSEEALLRFFSQPRPLLTGLELGDATNFTCVRPFPIARRNLSPAMQRGVYDGSGGVVPADGPSFFSRHSRNGR